MRTIYVLSLVTVAKINPQVLTKGGAIEASSTPVYELLPMSIL